MGFEDKYKTGTPVEEFEKSLQGLSEGTRKIYTDYLEEFLQWHGQTVDDLYQWVKSLETSGEPIDRKQLTYAFNDFAEYRQSEEGGEVSTSTVLNYRKAIHKFLEANELTIRVKKPDNITKSVGQDIINLDQVKKLVKLAENNLRLRALLLTLKDTGLGISEVVMLTCEDYYKAAEYRINDRRYKKWKDPITRQKTGELCEVCLGPEAISAIEDYIGNRKTGAVFLTIKGMPHQDEDGNMNPEAGYTEKGSPLNARAVSGSIRNHARVLNRKGYKISAHSFRKLFETSFAVEGVLDAAKKIIGKAINSSDKPYLKFGDKLIEVYARVYEKHLLLDDTARELQQLKERQKDQNGLVSELQSELRTVKQQLAETQRILNNDEVLNMLQEWKRHGWNGEPSEILEEAEWEKEKERINIELLKEEAKRKGDAEK